MRLDIYTSVWYSDGMKPRLYSTVEAAAYLGVNPETLRYHIYDKQHIQADYTIGRDLAFLEETLDAFRQKHQAQGLTIKEAALYLGIDVTVVRYHVYTSKRLKPDGKRGTAMVFFLETLDSLKRRR